MRIDIKAVEIHNRKLIDLIIDYESGQLTHGEIINLFQLLIDTGLLNELQGSYARKARLLMEDGFIQGRV